MLKFEIPIWTTMLWVRASVISRNLQWDQCYSDICDDMSEFEVFCSTRSEYGSSIALSNFQLDRILFKFHLQWYWTDFFEMTNIERILKKCSNFKCIWTTRVNMGHLSHRVNVNLIATGLSSPCNDIKYNSLSLQI